MKKYFMETNNHEWLLTNGLGGYALGTGNLINQRKYHGLLISSEDGVNRNHLLSGLEIIAEWRGESFHLDSSNYSSCIYPEGFLHLVKSWLRPYPTFLYSSLHHNNDILIKLEFLLADDANTLLVRLSNLGKHRLKFTVRPKITLRNHHHTNSPSSWNEADFATTIADNKFSVKRYSNNLSLHGTISNGDISDERITFYDCYYPWEAIRGYYSVENLYSPVKINFSLKVNETSDLLFSDIETEYDETVSQICRKYKKLPLPKDYPATHTPDILNSLDFEDEILFDYKDYFKLLEFSLQDFMIKDNIIAGYPWFGCWGRDTFIFMEAVISNKNVWKIIKNYASELKEGLIPNMLDESGSGGNYNSIDGTLWFLMRIYDFIKNNKVSATRINEALKIYEQILPHLLADKDKHYLGAEGFLYLEDSFAGATWMDAKVDGKAVTPRTGAPIEINALFFNALSAYEELSSFYKKKTGSVTDLIDKVSSHIKLMKESFQFFTIDNYLADCYEHNTPAAAIRPNALIAISLPFPIISKDVMKAVVIKAKEELLTPYGIRTLSPNDYRFKRKYLGNQKERDSQYHQGTVWPFLLKFYASAYLNAFSDEKNNSELAEELTAVIAKLRNGFMRGHIASVAEVFDGEKPHIPKGCPAQAWSVAALYKIEILIQSLGGVNK